MTRLSWGPQRAPAPPARQSMDDAMREWSARYHGPGWAATRAAYWADPPRWRRTRCYWCRRADPRSGKRLWRSRRNLQLNHLTYRFSDSTGTCPFWAVRPMCKPCHTVETWLTGRLRQVLRRLNGKHPRRTRDTDGPVVRAWLWCRRVARWEQLAHILASWGGRQVANLTLLLPVLWLVSHTF